MILTILIHHLDHKDVMDNITKNRISNIMYSFGIKDNMDNFNKIAKHTNSKQIGLYKTIFHIV